MKSSTLIRRILPLLLLRVVSLFIALLETFAVGLRATMIISGVNGVKSSLMRLGHSMNRIDSIAFLEAFQAYVKAWRELESEYYRIPSWRWIKQHRNISKRMQLTRVYTARMKHWGILA